VVLQPAVQPYATLALGSALAGFMYPHTVTSVLAVSRSAQVIRKECDLLPAYNFCWGMVALLGIVAWRGLHLGSSKDGCRRVYAGVSRWFLGFAFAAITVAALVPAAIMSIARRICLRGICMWSICTRRVRRGHSTGRELRSLALMRARCGGGADADAVCDQFAADGGVLILQTLPAISLVVARFSSRRLLVGWQRAWGCVVLLMRLKLQARRIHSAVWAVYRYMLDYCAGGESGDRSGWDGPDGCDARGRGRDGRRQQTICVAIPADASRLGFPPGHIVTSSACEIQGALLEVPDFLKSPPLTMEMAGGTTWRLKAAFTCCGVRRSPLPQSWRPTAWCGPNARG